MAAFALTEVHLAEVVSDANLEIQVTRQRSSGLLRALQRGGVNGADRLTRQSLADLLGLPLAERRQWWVAVSVRQGEGLPIDEGGRLAMTDQHDLTGPRLGRKKRLGIRLGFTHGQRTYNDGG